MVVRGAVDTGVFIEFFKRLVRGSPRKIVLICDGHPVHRARKTATFVGSLQGALQLFFLTPHSPGLNPDELA